MKLTNKEWKEILDYEDIEFGRLWARIVDTVLDNVELVPLPQEDGYCPRFSITTKSITKVKKDLESLVGDE
jgi:hypothetical protein